eukprot:CAMPEP_0198436844 /NCGR_PEP_ID=MMETSP1452-20131203/44217_1 /TAXON_ID=1181717 /ORGANISM="Synchroma pusillum, Strain CCMP3072" /LENGTH=346 /DNA_ID=CAMNT_0044157403 /DNA_START=9 /DNA_END=1049 /DNA_ORIENTATION=+
MAAPPTTLGKSLFYISLWMFCSVSMIIFNKAILSTFEFPFPMALTAWHMLFATVCTQILARTTSLLPSVAKGTVTRGDYFGRVVPVAMTFAVSLILSNTAYVTLSVSFIQMLKASTPVVVLLLSFVCGLEKPSTVYVQIIALVCLGVALASVGEVLFEINGFIAQVLAVLAEATRLVLVNLILKQLKLDSLSGVYYTAPACMAAILVPFFCFEYPRLSMDVFTPTFCIILLINGCVAFSLNLAVLLLIKNSSALLLTLAGIVKDILLVCLSFFIFASPVAELQVVGFSISLFGLFAYKNYKSSPEKFNEVGLIGGLASSVFGTGAAGASANGHSPLPVASENSGSK